MAQALAATRSAIRAPVTQLIERRSDDELRAADDQSRRPRSARRSSRRSTRIDHDRPVCFIAYTIKGFGLPLAGHKDNHAGLMTPAQMETFRDAMNIRAGQEWDRVRGPAATRRRARRRFSTAVPFARAGDAPLAAPPIVAVPDRARRHRSSRRCRRSTASARCSTRSRAATAACRAHRHDLARRDGVDQSRRLGQPPRPVRARRRMADTFQERDASPRRSTGNSRRRASTSSSASPR